MIGANLPIIIYYKLFKKKSLINASSAQYTPRRGVFRGGGGKGALLRPSKNFLVNDPSSYNLKKREGKRENPREKGVMRKKNS